MPNASMVTISEARLGRDPELRYVGEQGRPVCDLWVAWDDGPRTNWGGVTVWAEQAVKVAEGTSKGSRIKVTGHLRSEEYEAKDGTRRRLIKVVAEQVEILSSRPLAATKEPAEPRQGKRAA
jgi:single-strand DNA-binding protein